MITLQKPYCTILDVQTETRNSDSENTQLYTQAINFASRYIDSYCARDFWNHDHRSEAYKVPRSRVLGGDLILPFPIIDLTSIRFSADPTVTSSPDQELSEIEYYYEEGSNLISISSTIQIDYPFLGRIELFGDFGYTLEVDEDGFPVIVAPPVDIPAAVRRAATIVAAAWSNERRVEQVALDGSRSQLLDNTVNKEVFALLGPFVSRTGNNF